MCMRVMCCNPFRFALGWDACGLSPLSGVGCKWVFCRAKSAMTLLWPGQQAPHCCLQGPLVTSSRPHPRLPALGRPLSQTALCPHQPARSQRCTVCAAPLEPNAFGSPSAASAIRSGRALVAPRAAKAASGAAVLEPPAKEETTPQDRAMSIFQPSGRTADLFDIETLQSQVTQFMSKCERTQSGQQAETSAATAWSDDLSVSGLARQQKIKPIGMCQSFMNAPCPFWLPSRRVVYACYAGRRPGANSKVQAGLLRAGEAAAGSDVPHRDRRTGQL